MSAHKPPAALTASACAPASLTGKSAACILVTILAANLAATRTEASLPYLVQGAPLSLRFTDPPPVLPPPPQRYSGEGPNPPDADAAAALKPDGSPAATPGSAGQPSAQTPSDPSAQGSPDAQTSLPPGTVTDEGVVILPDTYAPRPMVRIDDLLPFFVPPTAPPSRATYELK
jgi:hypothetical protein